MKHLTLTILVLLSQSIAYSQVSYRFNRDHSSGRDSLLFRITCASGCIRDTTSDRVVHYVAGQDKIVSFLLRIAADSNTVSYRIYDSLVHHRELCDSILKHSYRPLQSRLILVNAGDVYADFPYEDVLLLEDKERPAQDSVKIEDPAGRKSLPAGFSLHGYVRVNAQLSDNKYLYQQTPASFIRTEVGTDINLFGVPFSSGYYHTTENNGMHPINNFRISFLYDKFDANVREQVLNRIKDDRGRNLDLRSGVNIDEVNREMIKLSKEVETGDFKRRYQRNLSLINAAEKDTVLKTSNKYKKAIKQKEFSDKKLGRLKLLQGLHDKYSREVKLAGIQTGTDERKLADPGNLRMSARKYKLLNPFQSLFLSVRRFDLGTFDPRHSTLMLNGINLTGVNVEVNPGYFYGALAWGRVATDHSFLLSVFTRPASGEVLAWRAGAGRKDRFLLSVSMLKGRVENGSPVMNTSGEASATYTNHVIGAEAVYKFSRTGETGIEYARSRNYAPYQEYNMYIGSRDAIKGDQSQYSSAWNAYARFSMNQGNTSFRTSVKVVDPFFYSMGTPFLRKDNARIEVKGEQFFLKRTISAGLTWRSDRDNLYNLKQGTSKVYSTMLSLQFRFKKAPYLILTYAPNFQYFFNSVLERNVFSRAIFYNALTGYLYQNKSVLINSSLSYSNQSNYTNQEEWIAYEVKQFSWMENILFKAHSFSLSAGVTYVMPKEIRDTGEVLMTLVNVSGPLFKKRISYLVGMRYQKDFSIQERLIAESSVSFMMPFRITAQAGIEKHFIYNFHQPAQRRENMILGRLSLLKLF